MRLILDSSRICTCSYVLVMHVHLVVMCSGSFLRSFAGDTIQDVALQEEDLSNAANANGHHCNADTMQRNKDEKDSEFLEAMGAETEGKSDLSCDIDAQLKHPTAPETGPATVKEGEGNQESPVDNIEADMPPFTSERVKQPSKQIALTPRKRQFEPGKEPFLN